MPAVGGGIRISAAKGEGIDHLLEKIEETLGLLPVCLRLELPFSKSGLAAQVRQECKILQEEYTERGILLEAELTPQLYQECLPYQIE